MHHQSKLTQSNLKSYDLSHFQFTDQSTGGFLYKCQPVFPNQLLYQGMLGLKNIVVTGSNKGIGYGIVENLAQKEGWNIIMACRSLERGKKARGELISRFPLARLFVEPLDITNPQSVGTFLDIIAEKYKNIHVLVNNAGVVEKGDVFDHSVAKNIFQTNFFGTVNLSEKIIPHVSQSGKIILCGGMVGKINRLKKDELKNLLRKEDLSREELFGFVDNFMEGVKENNFAERGFPKNIYAVSKLAINHYAKVMSNYAEIKKKNIQVYSLCPGYCKTDMTKNKGPLTIQQGAKTAVHLTELPFEVNPELQGKFFEKSAISSLQ